MNNGEPVTCPRCGTELGKVLDLGGGVQALQAGGLIIREGHGMACAQCGRAVHWDINDQRLEKLIRDVQAMRGSFTNAIADDGVSPKGRGVKGE